ncbi:MAG TPA: hypothetical protein VMJ10_02390 [Kofleriaceae bacterium]|nr:hypothetical protein [Kofleriaceae bacterium]
MLRLACVLVVVGACSSSGPGTGAAMLSNVTPAIKSAAASSFENDDMSGTKVLGWSIDFYVGGPGSDCTSKGKNVTASIAIFTNQAAGGTQKEATLMDTDISIVTTAPPSTSNNFAANMGADGVSNIQGIVTISDFAPDHITGTVTAGGVDSNQASVTLDGSFMAPICT